ncbi:MAG: aspartate-semialdehyde dehydrogenase [Actinomycetota bacterium]
MRIVLLGATGAVGTEMLNILEERSFPVDELVPVASPRSVGRRLPFAGGEIEVRALTPEVFDGADIVFVDVDDPLSVKWAPIAAERGGVVIDKSAAWRMDPDVPLVVPEVNPEAINQRPKGIVANPNCTTLAMVLPLDVLHREAGLERLVVASYQAASGTGKAGSDELWDQTQRLAKEEEAVLGGRIESVLSAGDVFPHPIAMNVIPRCGSFKTNGYTSEELKLRDETRKIMGLPELRVAATCVRVPVMVGHGVAVHAEFADPITPDRARELLAGAPGIELLDDESADSYPTALQAAGRDACYVGRIRQDHDDPAALELFCVADNLRKGAALNAVQIAELLLR